MFEKKNGYMMSARVTRDSHILRWPVLRGIHHILFHMHENNFHNFIMRPFIVDYPQQYQCGLCGRKCVSDIWWMCNMVPPQGSIITTDLTTNYDWDSPRIKCLFCRKAAAATTNYFAPNMTLLYSYVFKFSDNRLSALVHCWSAFHWRKFCKVKQKYKI